MPGGRGPLAVRYAVVDVTSAPLRARLASQIEHGELGDLGLEDETLDMVREQF